MINTNNIPEQKLSLSPPANNEAVLTLILQRVRLLAAIRIAWLRSVWTETLQNEETSSNNHSEVDGYLNNIDDPVEEAAWRAVEESIQPIQEECLEIENLLAGEQVSKLYLLSTIFRLNEVEKDVLQACLCQILEPNMGRIYAYLQDHNGRTYVTSSLVRRLFGHKNIIPLPASSPLFKWKLIREVETGRGEPSRLECDPFIRNWLLGINELDEVLSGIAKWQASYMPLPHWPVSETVTAISRIMYSEKHPAIRLLVSGPEGIGRKTFAEAVSRKLGLQLLTIDSDRIPEDQWSQVYLHAQRQAYLDRFALLWKGDAVGQKPWSQQIPSFNLQFVIGDPGATMTPEDDMMDYKVDLPPIPAEEGLRLWQQWIPAAAQWSQVELQNLTLRHKVTIGQITGAARKGVTTIEEASVCIKEHSRQKLGKLAQQMNGAFTWDDLIVAPQLRSTLEDFSFEAAERNEVWEVAETRRLFPQGRGLIALFTGAPGTGKTMAAQVIANSLQLDLFRIDLSAIVSKYVGETSRNIDRILSKAGSSNIILLFDEADALFGKRTEIKDAHDRFANTDTNYLLQAIEDYPGIILLSSNKKANIDAGFLRRLRYVLDFPKPDVQQRYQLWKQLLTALASGQMAADLDERLLQLAEMLEITGAQIKMAVLSALFIARKEKSSITLHHLLNGLERELVKEGRGLGRRVVEAFKI